MAECQALIAQQPIVAGVGGAVGIPLSWMLYRLCIDLYVVRLCALIPLGFAYYTGIFALTVLCLSREAAVAASPFMVVITLVAVLHNQVFFLGVLQPSPIAHTDGGNPA